MGPCSVLWWSEPPWHNAYSSCACPALSHPHSRRLLPLHLPRFKQYVLLACEHKPRPPPPAAPLPGGDDDCCKKRPGGGKPKRCSDESSWDDENDSDDESGMPMLMERASRPKRFGVPLLVPFPAHLAAKGPEAERHLRQVRRGGGGVQERGLAAHLLASTAAFSCAPHTPPACHSLGLTPCATYSPPLAPTTPAQAFDTAMKPFFAEGSSLGTAAMPHLKFYVSPVSGSRLGHETLGW